MNKKEPHSKETYNMVCTPTPSEDRQISLSLHQMGPEPLLPTWKRFRSLGM